MNADPNCKLCHGSGQRPVHLLTRTVYDPCDCTRRAAPTDPRIPTVNGTVPDVLTSGLAHCVGEGIYPINSNQQGMLRNAALIAHDGFYTGLNVVTITTSTTTSEAFQNAYMQEFKLAWPSFLMTWIVCEGTMSAFDDDYIEWRHHCLHSQLGPPAIGGSCRGLLITRTQLRAAYDEIAKSWGTGNLRKIGDGHDNFILIDII